MGSLLARAYKRILRGKLAQDEGEHWVTVNAGSKEGGEGGGSHVLLDGEGRVVAGMGGKFKGQNIDRIERKKFINQNAWNRQRKALIEKAGDDTQLKRVVTAGMRSQAEKEADKSNDTWQKEGLYNALVRRTQRENKGMINVLHDHLDHKNAQPKAVNPIAEKIQKQSDGIKQIVTEAITKYNDLEAVNQLNSVPDGVNVVTEKGQFFKTGDLWSSPDGKKTLENDQMFRLLKKELKAKQEAPKTDRKSLIDQVNARHTMPMGDIIARKEQAITDKINNSNLSDEDKKKYLDKLNSLTDEALKAGAGSLDLYKVGVSYKKTNAETNAFNKMYVEQGKIDDLEKDLDFAIFTKHRQEKKQGILSGIEEANKEGAIYFKDPSGKEYYRTNANSKTWNSVNEANREKADKAREKQEALNYEKKANSSGLGTFKFDGGKITISEVQKNGSTETQLKVDRGMLPTDVKQLLQSKGFNVNPVKRTWWHIGSMLDGSRKDILKALNAQAVAPKAETPKGEEVQAEAPKAENKGGNALLDSAGRRDQHEAAYKERAKIVKELRKLNVSNPGGDLTFSKYGRTFKRIPDLEGNISTNWGEVGRTGEIYKPEYTHKQGRFSNEKERQYKEWHDRREQWIRDAGLDPIKDRPQYFYDKATNTESFRQIYDPNDTWIKYDDNLPEKDYKFFKEAKQRAKDAGLAVKEEQPRSIKNAFSDKYQKIDNSNLNKYQEVDNISNNKNTENGVTNMNTNQESQATAEAKSLEDQYRADPLRGHAFKDGSMQIGRGVEKDQQSAVVKFYNQPEQSTIDMLKQNGFEWMPSKKSWVHKGEIGNKSHLDVLKALKGVAPAPQPSQATPTAQPTTSQAAQPTAYDVLNAKTPDAVSKADLSEAIETLKNNKYAVTEQNIKKALQWRKHSKLADDLIAQSPKSFKLKDLQTQAGLQSIFPKDIDVKADWKAYNYHTGYEPTTRHAGYESGNKKTKPYNDLVNNRGNIVMFANKDGSQSGYGLITDYVNGVEVAHLITPETHASVTDHRIKQGDQSISGYIANEEAKEKASRETERQARIAKEGKSYNGTGIEYKNGRYEISFNSFPSFQLRTDMKNNGFRWDPNAKVWHTTDREKLDQVLSKHFSERDAGESPTQA